MSLLQEHLEELGSAIIDICDDKIKLTGFMLPERLLDYSERGYDCRFSIGVYPNDKFNVALVMDNALILILENGIKIIKYQFKPIKNDTIKYKDENNVSRSKVYSIRKCNYSGKYNYKDMDKSILFDYKLELESYFLKQYRTSLII